MRSGKKTSRPFSNRGKAHPILKKDHADIFSRWWFASTAFPLIAGTFGPMASAFSICALVHSWRIHVEPGQTDDQGQTIDDPRWYVFLIISYLRALLTISRLIIINAVQLAIALISNLSLLMNMARRIRFSIAQPITIIGWYGEYSLFIDSFMPSEVNEIHRLPVFLICCDGFPARRLHTNKFTDMNQSPRSLWSASASVWVKSKTIKITAKHTSMPSSLPACTSS